MERQSLANKIADQPEMNSHPAHAAVLAFAGLASETRTLDLINRYESRYDRQYFRAHRRLLEIQDHRLRNEMRNEPDNTPPPAPAPEAHNPPSTETDFAKRTQAHVENTALDPEPVASSTPTTRSFYLDAMPPAFFHPAPPENPAVFRAGTAATHP
jgi:hypothetical protein